jgi:hypothetical protein
MGLRARKRPKESNPASQTRRIRTIPVERMSRQSLAGGTRSPVALVTDFGAMQAQEYEQAKWAVGVRTPGTTHLDIERELAEGTILRTHPMRGTHHFVARDDLRWLMALMGPLMIQRHARRSRELDLDERTLGKALRAIQRALETGVHLTRAETAAVLQRAKISPDGQRLSHIIYRAELEALVCSGRRKGKQVTIALVDERAPATGARMSREDSLRELATRYFTTRGPATVDDFRWWCQLPASDVRAAIELAKPAADGALLSLGAATRARAPEALLLPPYDEYLVAYRDRSAAGSPPASARSFGETTLLGPTIVVDGRVVGSWRRTQQARGATTALVTPWTKQTPKARRAIDSAIARYQAFWS